MERSTLQENLVQLRKANGYTQKQLGDYLEITRQAYSHYEKGERIPNYVVLEKLANFYGITIDDLVSANKAHKKTLDEEGVPFRYLPFREREVVGIMQELSLDDQDELLIYVRRLIARRKAEAEARQAALQAADVPKTDAAETNVTEENK